MNNKKILSKDNDSFANQQGRKYLILALNKTTKESYNLYEQEKHTRELSLYLLPKTALLLPEFNYLKTIHFNLSEIVIELKKK